MTDLPKETQLVLDEALVQKIIQGVHATFVNMVGITPRAQGHKILHEIDILGDVSGIITLMQETMNGTFVVSFPKETILAMLGRIYKKPFTEITPSVKSGVGELTNMIYGATKASLNRTGYAFKMARPNVILGEQHTVLGGAPGPSLLIPFSTTIGDFNVILSLERPYVQTNAA